MRFYIGKLSVALHSALSAEPTARHSSWREGGFWLGNIVYKAQPTSDSVDHLLSSRSTEDWPSQAIASTIGNPNGVFVILYSKKLEDWTKKLFVPRLVWSFNHSDGEERLCHFCTLPCDFVGTRQAL